MTGEPGAVPLRDARPPLVIAIDAGTSGIRVAAFDARARLVARTVTTAARLPATTRDGGSTFDPDERASAVGACLDGTVRALGRRAGDVGAVGLTTFWHGLLGIDARGAPTTRLVTWADTRPGPAAAALRLEHDAVAVHARTGCTLHASYWPAKLRWLRDAGDGRAARTARWLSFGEYLSLRLFGEARAAHGMASATGVYDQARRGWDVPFLAALGVPPGAVAPISDEAQSGLRPTFARRWPALARVPWLPAVGDGATSNVGSGAVGPGVAALMLGTSGAIRVLRELATPPVVPGGWTYRLDARRVCTGGALSNGGNVLTWIRATFPQVDVDALARRATDAHLLTALPLLSGDRSPTWNDAARAAITGIGLGHTADDLARALIEGLVLRFALLWELIDRGVPGIERVIATGGGVLGHPWLVQLLADALGRPLVASAAGEASARGVALLALERIGAVPDLLAIRAPLGRTYRPRPSEHERLRAALGRQRSLEGAIAGVT